MLIPSHALPGDSNVPLSAENQPNAKCHHFKLWEHTYQSMLVNEVVLQSTKIILALTVVIMKSQRTWTFSVSYHLPLWSTVQTKVCEQKTVYIQTAYSLLNLFPIHFHVRKFPLNGDKFTLVFIMPVVPDVRDTVYILETKDFLKKTGFCSTHVPFYICLTIFCYLTCQNILLCRSWLLHDFRHLNYASQTC